MTYFKWLIRYRKFMNMVLEKDLGQLSVPVTNDINERCFNVYNKT